MPGDTDQPSVWLPRNRDYVAQCLMSDVSTRTKHDSSGKRSATTCADFLMPESEGEYRLQFGYGAAAYVEFKIVEPILEGWTPVLLAKPNQGQLPDATGKRLGSVRTLTRLVRFMVLGCQASHFIAVSIDPVSGPAPLPVPMG